MRRVLFLSVIVLSIGVLALAAFYPNFIARAGKDYLDQPTQPQISLPLGKPISLRVNGKGNSPLALGDARDIATSFTGAVSKRKIEDRSARPLSLAAGDFDEDGVPDLVSGYASDDANLLVIHRGNVDAIYADTPEANERKARGDSLTRLSFLRHEYSKCRNAPTSLEREISTPMAEGILLSPPWAARDFIGWRVMAMAVWANLRPSSCPAE